MTNPQGHQESQQKCCYSENGVRWMTDVLSAAVKKGNIPEDWSKSWIVSIYIGKGDALECNSYRAM